MTEIAAGHVSGYYDGSVDNWRQAFRMTANTGAKVITTTETGHAPLEAARPVGWQHTRLSHRPGSDECSILWDKDTWAPASDSYAMRLSTTPFYDADGDPAPHHPVYAIVAPLKLRRNPDFVCIFAGAHLPSGVQAADGWSDQKPRVDAWFESIRHLPAALYPARRRHPHAPRCVGADLNVDLGKPWVRDVLARELPAFRPSWQNHYPGTHQLRTIDAHLVGELLQFRYKSGSAVVGSVHGFDHRPLITRMTAAMPPRP